MRGAPQTFGDDSLYVENKLHYSSIKAKGSQDISNIMVSVLESVIGLWLFLIDIYDFVRQQSYLKIGGA